MSALGKLKQSLVGPTAEQIAAVGQSLVQSADGLDRRVDELRRTPVTIAQLLGAEPVTHGINFAGLDALLVRAETIEAAAPGATFDFAGQQSLSACIERLRDVLEVAQPYREARRS